MIHKIDIKPLSVNEAWKGRRFKTDKYKAFQRSMLFLLPKIQLPAAPYELHFKFGFSSPASDIDNPCKLCIDILQKKYGFNDKEVFKMVVEKIIVPQGSEFVSFEILTYNGIRL